MNNPKESRVASHLGDSLRHAQPLLDIICTYYRVCSFNTLQCYISLCCARLLGCFFSLAFASVGSLGLVFRASFALYISGLCLLLLPTGACTVVFHLNKPLKQIILTFPHAVPEITTYNNLKVTLFENFAVLVLFNLKSKLTFTCV